MRIVRCRIALLAFAVLCFSSSAIVAQLQQPVTSDYPVQQKSYFQFKDNVLSQDSAGTISPDRVQVVKVTHVVDPKFPRWSRQTGICVLSLTVDTDGKPQGITIKKSLKPSYDDSAIKAVRQYRFDPATLDGKPVTMEINIQVSYQVR